MATTRPKPTAVDAVPQPPQTTPTALPGLQDHGFTLGLIMELNKSVGQLTASVESMKTSLESVKGKVDSLQSWKQMIVGGALVLVAMSSVITWLATKASDFLVFKSSIAPLAVVEPVKPSDATRPPTVPKP